MEDQLSLEEMENRLAGTWLCFDGQGVITVYMDGMYSNETQCQGDGIIRIWGTWELFGPLGIRNVMKMRRTFISAQRIEQNGDTQEISIYDLGIAFIVDSEGFTYSVTEVLPSPQNQAVDCLFESNPLASAERAWSTYSASRCNKLGERMPDRYSVRQKTVMDAEPDVVPCAEPATTAGNMDQAVETASQVILRIYFMTGEELCMEAQSSDTVGMVRMRIRGSRPEFHGRLRLMIGNNLLKDDAVLSNLSSLEIQAAMAQGWIRSEEYFEYEPITLLQGFEQAKAEDIADSTPGCIAYVRRQGGGHIYLVKHKYNKLDVTSPARPEWEWYDRNE